MGTVRGRDRQEAIVGPANKGVRNRMQKYRRVWTVPMLLPQECGRSGNGSKCFHHRSGQNFTVLFACIRHYFPRQGGNLNCAGAHHGSFTPPRISRSCVQEYHCKLTRSWRSSLPKLHLTWVGIALHLIWPSFDAESFRTGGLRASSASLFHFWLIRLMSFSRWICTFQAARGGLKKIPSCGRQRERLF